MGAIQQMLLAEKFSAPAHTYATWDPAHKGSGVVLSGGNLVVSNNTSLGTVRSNIAVSSGKWYWEVYVEISTAQCGLGVDGGNLETGCGDDAYAAGYRADYAGSSVIRFFGSTQSFYTLKTAPYTLGIALDLTSTGVVDFYYNNVLQATRTVGIAPWYAMHSQSTGGAAATANFGATPFTYTPPAGYNAGLYT